MIANNDGIQCFLICLFLFHLNPNCKVLCDGAKELKSTTKFCDVPTVLPHTNNITYQCTKYIKNQSKSCVYNATVFESTAIKISCDAGYSTDATVSFCSGNQWVPPITGCSKKCKKLNPVNVHLECFRKNISIPCDEKYLVSGVTVRPTCDHLNSSGFQFYPGHQEIHCQVDGNWDNDLLSCVQDCGRLQKNSSDSETPNMPWNVMIYHHKGKTKCFGTIISPRVILTTEYCVRNIMSDYDDYSSMNRPLDPTGYNVGLFGDSAPNSSGWSRLKYYAYKLGPCKRICKHQRFTPLMVKEFRYYKEGKQDKFFFHDVLIVIMEKEINFDSQVSPACVQWENPNRLNITTGIAKVQQWNDNAEKYGYEDYSFWSHDACQENPNYPHLVYNWACLMHGFDNANRHRNDTKRFRESNQTAFHAGKLFCMEQKLDQLNHSMIVHGSGVMIEKDDRYFIRGIAGEVFRRDTSNNDAHFKYFMNVAHYLANTSYEDFSKNISDAVINGSSDTEFVDLSVFLFNYNFSSLLQNHLKSVGSELPNYEKRLVGVTDVADYVDWIKHVVAEVDPYYNLST
ncbi:uncharacterized protein LOC135840332 [Planococcus citri]|uniref:uncharacterized protein LOC135840332 n=1 Tax=Planococcus citri TaxID=170843 RepID=UPI0031F870CA